MGSDDINLINKHLEALRREVIELDRAVARASALEREATLHELHRALEPALAALARLEAGASDIGAHKVADALAAARPALGLERHLDSGELHDLFPEEAREDFVLDRPVPEGATLVRVEVLAAGWRRGLMVVVRPVARVLETSEGGEDG